MIMTPDQAAKRISDTNLELEVGPDEPPPAYSYSYLPPIDSEPGTSGASSTFKTKPTNFLALSNEHDSIRGEFVIDPCIYIPSSVLPPFGHHQTEHDRRNLYLKSESSSVHAEIWLLGNSQGSTSIPPTRRTTIALASGHGSIHVQLNTLEDTAPFSLTANAPHGSVRLALPRSFQGLISVSTRHGSITLSDSLIQNATQLSQLGSTRRYFVGDFSLFGGEVWRGDQIDLESEHGSIRLKYVDEDAAERRKRGLFSRLFRD